MSHCLYCQQPIVRNLVGRSPVYCSSSCKQAAYRFRKNDFKRVRVSASCRSLSLRNVFSKLTEIWRVRFKGHVSDVIYYGFPSDDELGVLLGFIQQREFLGYDRPRSCLTLRNAGMVVL